ncbi:MAG: DNA primase, partial [Candidatus Zixiibacteriota bacterium]
KRRGRNYEALCPFHTEKTPSFKVSADKQIYHCFGCGKGGNVFTFLMEHEQMTFIEAVRFLAERANITIRESVSDTHREELEKLHFAQEVALRYFTERMQEPRYRDALDSYLFKTRQLTPETVKLFQLGFSGDKPDGLIRYARTKDLTVEDLMKAGLAVYDEDKKGYRDRFLYRLMIPIFNLSWKPIAFGGRSLKKGQRAKYMNSPETPLYHKSNVLYGLNFSRDAIRDNDAVLIVEGYFDVISLWQAGVRNVVASSGTAFTPQQARLLARFATEVYLFFDADSAGQKAALRSVDALFDAGLEVKVIVPPEGEDPDSLARQYGRDKIDELVHDAIGYIPFRMRQVDTRSTGLIAREKLVKELRALGEKISDPTRRALFIQEAADTLNVDPQLLRGGQARPARAGIDVAPPSPRRREEELLSVLLNNPGCIDEVFTRIAPVDFDSRSLGRLYAAMIQQYRSTGRLDAGELVATFGDDSEMISTLTGVAAHEWEPSQIDSEARARMADFIRRNQKRIIERLKNDLREAENSGDHAKAALILEEMKAHGL